MSETKKNDLIKARKHCKIFKFIETLNFVEDGGKFKTNYCMKYLSSGIRASKENTDKPDASFLDSEYQKRDEKF